MNLIEITAAFAEGLGLILSPCILPVLPLILASSVDGGRKRPFGIILGFVLAFSAFVLLSRKLVEFFHIDLDVIKYASLVLLGVLGLVLLSSKLSEKFNSFTQGAANWGGQLTQNAGNGFVSGMMIGALIGLVWTPCAGPFLAAILVQVIRQENDVSAVFQVLSFALGAGVPMLIIALMGRKIMSKLGFFTRHAETVRKGFGVLILLVVVLIGFGFDKKLATLDGGTPMDVSSSAAINEHGLTNGLAQPYPAPEFAGIEAWLNSNPQTMASLKGKVVLIDFWTYSCINCVRTLPYITAWDAKYKDKGLVIIGVHSPEFEFEKKRENVESAIKEHGIEYAVALDNKLDTWSNFQNKYWPAHYLINKEGQVVYTHFGEGHYDITESNIRFLLGIQGDEGKAEVQATAANSTANITPETYLGYGRGERLKNDAQTKKDVVATYTLPAQLAENEWALDGKWKREVERIVAAEKGAKLRLHFQSKKVFLVLGTSSGKPVTAHMMLNGKAPGAAAGKDAADGMVTVERNTLYELINQDASQSGTVEINADAPGLEAYAFTFGG